MQLTWDEFTSICKNNAGLTTNRHKTGKYYTVYYYIRNVEIVCTEGFKFAIPPINQREFLKKQRGKYIEEFHVEPKFISRPQRTSICNRPFVAVSGKSFFGDDKTKVWCNANYSKGLGENVDCHKGQRERRVHRAHLAQTAHSEKRPKKMSFQERNPRGTECFGNKFGTTAVFRDDESQLDSLPTVALPGEEVCSAFEEEPVTEDSPHHDSS